MSLPDLTREYKLDLRRCLHCPETRAERNDDLCPTRVEAWGREQREAGRAEERADIAARLSAMAPACDYHDMDDYERAGADILADIEAGRHVGAAKGQP